MMGNIPFLYIIAAVHGFANATYDVVEGERLDTFFQLNVKGMTAFPSLIIQGTVTTVAGGTASKWNDDYYLHTDSFHP